MRRLGQGARAGQANSLQDPISKIHRTKWTGGVAEFKPQAHPHPPQKNHLSGSLRCRTALDAVHGAIFH
jgi:hypothetical protein